MLISNAIDQSLAKIDFRPLSGHRVYIDEKYIDSVNRLRSGLVGHRLLRVGADIEEKPDEAEMIVEVRSGAVGTDDHSLMVGIPPINLGPMMSTPEIAIFKRETQTGTAKIGLVAYDARSKHVLGAGAVTRAQSQDKNWFVLGTGPYNSGTLKREIAISNDPHQIGDFPLDVNDAGKSYVHNGQVQQTVFLAPDSTVPGRLNPIEGIAHESQTQANDYTPAGHNATQK